MLTEIRFAVGGRNQETCTIYYFANGAVGWYGVTVQIEDFETDSNINTNPLSSVPLQFLAQVFESNELCSSKPTFIGPTPTDSSCIGIPFNTVYHSTIVANASSKSDSIREINTVSPVGMTKSAVLPYGTSGTSYYINVTWSPMTSQQGSHIFCFSAVNLARLSSDQTCVTLVVGGMTK
ncbi:hypothetical protein KUTeg_004693 [Tegillarca granosa]|uniref:Uncharacterized protein n=1 Tax=Tegillarca granosa TaxID=220873 RepID=A0ABQ9FHP1_TEGGR|nr:hypothetical protein KUTeg_004693 [Tegillarca granosa]